MDLIVNGKSHVLDEGSPIVNLLVALGLDGQPCAVEVNRKVVPKREHESHELNEGDKIEIVTLVGGG